MKSVEFIRCPHQKGHNCAWGSSATPTFRGIVLVRCLQRNKPLEEAVKISKRIYKDWEYYDRKQNIQNFLALHLEDPEYQIVRRKILTCIYHCLTTEPPSAWKQEIIELIKDERLQDTQPDFKISEGSYSYTFEK